MGRTKKVKPVVVATCHLCRHFFHSTLLRNDQVHNPRLCVAENREILSVDPVCDSFHMADYFFCDKTNHQITFQMCNQRNIRRMDECRACKQRAQVIIAEAISAGEDPPPVSDSRPALKIRAVVPEHEEYIPETKPIFKKRASVTLLEKPQ